MNNAPIYKSQGCVVLSKNPLCVSIKPCRAIAKPLHTNYKDKGGEHSH